MSKLLIFVLLIASIIGCSAVPDKEVVCQTLTSDPAIDITKQININSERLVEMVASNYPNAKDSINIYTAASDESLKTVVWDDGSRSYTARFKGEVLQVIVISWNKPRPSMNQALQCTGVPNFYSAEYKQGEVNSVELNLWYLPQNMVITGVQFGSNDELNIDGDLELWHIGIPVESLADRIQDKSPVPLLTTIPSDNLKPWVEKWEDIQIDQE